VDGAGNPGGSGDAVGENGTGGLLIMYANSIANNGTIDSNGSKGGNTNTGSGGSSGAGSINIFYNEQYQNAGTIEAVGVNSTSSAKSGDGSVTIGTIKTGDYADLEQ